MQLLPETRLYLSRELPLSEESALTRRAMSVGNSEKWILVEWGNCTRGIVHSRYLVNVDNRELQAGCSVIIGKRGEQQIATFLARSNERPLLEQILKQSNETEQEGAGPSAPVDAAADEEPGDFSGSASSWAPSENDVSESSEEENIMEEHEEKPNPEEILPPKENEPPPEEDIPKKRNTKKVLTPSNRVNAIIPNSMKKRSPKTKAKANNNTRKRKRQDDKENCAIEVQAVPAKDEQIQPKLVNININAEDILVMKSMFKELFKIFRHVRRMYKTTTVEKDRADQREVNAPFAQEEAENELEKSRDEDLNRSDDNVLITNKYGNIENNTQNSNNTTPNVNNPTKTVNNTTQNDTNNTQNDNNNTQNTDKGDVYNIQNEAARDEWVPIGSGKTLIHKDKFRKVKWTSYTMATRGLLLAVFPRRVLATHSLTGKRSPAFQHKPAKMCLDPKKVSDIVIEVMDRFRVRENLIRSIITTKCADEGKMFRMRMEKKKKQSYRNEEVPDDFQDNEQVAEEETLKE